MEKTSAAAGSPFAGARDERFRRVFEHAGVGIAIADWDWTIQSCNPAFARLVGYAPEELLGCKVARLIHPDDAAPNAEQRRRLRAGELSFFENESRYVRKDGAPVWVRKFICPLPDGSATPWIVALVTDVSDRKHAEEALRERERAFRTLVENLPDLVLRVDAGLRCVYVNPAAARGLGRTAAELLGRKIGELVPADAAAPLEAALRDVFETGRDASVELMIPSPEGPRAVDVCRVPELSPSGAVETVLAVGRDVTERRRTEEALRLYEVLAGLSRDIVLFMRRDDGRILEANAAAATAYGYSREELRELSIRDLRAPNTLGLTDAQMERADASGLLFETVHRRKDGSTFHAEVSSRGATVGGMRTLMSVVRDVTERKEAELALAAAHERLVEADRRKTEFLAVLSHELRNPLAPIRNSVFLLERAPPEGEHAARAREILRRQTEHLTRLVDDLLDVTRISRGKIALQRVRVDLGEVARRTADDLRSVFTAADVELRVEALGSGPAFVDGDATRLAQVVGNLLQNAVKFTPGGGRVVVRTGPAGEAAELRVEDDGAGMEPGTIEHMFEPFAQAAQPLARTVGGLGLGLALVKGLVELHGGSVRARSEGLGFGSEFVVTLPLAARRADAGSVVGASTGGGSRLVLVIEDNRDAGQSLADVLELKGHRARLALDGTTGVALARELSPDVVLCDLGLPDLDGYAVARALRSDEACRSIRLVALSGYAQPEDRRRAREAGFDAHLAKPPDLDELFALLAAPGRPPRSDRE